MPRPRGPELTARLTRRTALGWLGAAAGATLVACSSPDSAPSASGAGSPAPGPTPGPAPSPGPTDPLTGAATVSAHPVVAVKIDNTSAARPQLGLAEADHVWVQEVEAGITRLVAVFHTTLPQKVGPVRSARSTDVELLSAYGAPLLVYSGANRDVTSRLKKGGFPTVSSGAGFRRLGDRPAPYNLTADLAALADARTLEPAHSLGLTYAATDSAWSTAESLGRTTVRVGQGSTRFAWTDGRYRVTDDGQRLTCDNVVILSVRNVADGNADVNGSRSVRSRTVGSGRVVVLREGRRRTGTWKRTAANRRFAFTDGAGPITLRPGKTWFLLQG